MTIPVRCTIAQSFEPAETAVFQIEVPDSFNGLGLPDRQLAAFPAIVEEICITQGRGNNVTAIVAVQVGQFQDMTAPFRPTSTWILN
jgi:hypothetical protein